MKFKVWDNIDSVFAQDVWFLIDQDGELWLFTHRESKMGIEKATDRFTPIFSTGKTDKNGAELFDGDICKAYDPAGNEYKCMIIYSDCRWNFLFDSGATDEIVDYHQDGNMVSRQVEKIGHRFENPELMEAT